MQDIESPLTVVELNKHLGQGAHDSEEIQLAKQKPVCQFSLLRLN